MKKLILKPFIKKYCKRNKTLTRALEDYLDLNNHSIIRIIDCNDERMVSKNVLILICTILEMNESDVLTESEQT